eukprot:gene8212-5917_t
MEHNSDFGSSKKFSDEMIQGWEDGLRAKFHTLSFSSAKVLRTPNNEDAGDVDFSVALPHPVPVKDLFPAKTRIRPPTCNNRNPKIQFFMADVKRMLSISHLTKKVERFVAFYDELLRNGGSELTMSANLRQHLNRCSHILFVYNGADSHRVETAMTNALHRTFGNGNWRIHGKVVVAIWTHAASLICWGDILQRDMDMEQAIEHIEQLTQENKKLKVSLSEIMHRLDTLEAANNAKASGKKRVSVEDAASREKKKK